MSNEKKKIILRVSRKMNEENRIPDQINTNRTTSRDAAYLYKAKNYTGLHPLVLHKIEKLINRNIFVDDSVDRTLIYQTLCRFYDRHRSDGGRHPTTYELFDTLIRMNKLFHMDIGSFRKMLQKMDFIWQKVEGSESTVVIENPLVRFERFNYLTQIRRSRVEECDEIFFVDEASYNQGMFMDINESNDFKKITGGWQQRVIYAVGTKSVICLKEIEEFNDAVFEKWIVTELCPYLARPSVIVIQNLDHHSTKLLETPNLYSSRVEIMNWLDYQNIPFDEQMSKYDLYALADEYTDLETPLYKVDGILKARGHKLLRLPKYVKELSPTPLLFKCFEKNWTSLAESGQLITKSGMSSLFSDMILSSATVLEGFTSSVIYNEQKMMAVEKNVDKVLDFMLKKVPIEPSTWMQKVDSDVPSCSDSDE